MAKDDPVVFCSEVAQRVPTPDYAHLLPKEIQPFTTQGVYDTGEHAHMSFIQGAGHGGSHPHLVHEFLSAIVGDRQPYPAAREAANITCAGILSHASALRHGDRMYLPEFTLLDA
jgi:hypothetical protein